MWVTQGCLIPVITLIYIRCLMNNDSNAAEICHSNLIYIFNRRRNSSRRTLRRRARMIKEAGRPPPKMTKRARTVPTASLSPGPVTARSAVEATVPTVPRRRRRRRCSLMTLTFCSLSSTSTPLGQATLLIRTWRTSSTCSDSTSRGLR